MLSYICAVPVQVEFTDENCMCKKHSAPVLAVEEILFNLN